MSAGNLDKVVKLASKPKNAIPKAKYVDVLVASTYSDDGSLNDVVRALALRLREPNTVVVFKVLLTLHQMIRSGSTDQLMEVLSQSDALRLHNVNAQNYEGYSPPVNMGNYGRYLESRIIAFKSLKHDVVRVQTESNRRSDGQGAASKARRLRHLSVEKGLLREVKAVQKVLDTLIRCRFYDDDLRDENTVLAFKMLVKDLLVLFQAGNEGVCNILEHYFEMSKVDATESFEIYKSFISQTDKVVDYLGVARKLHNILNVPVPNLKHAPTGLVKALEEYLHDPNFENNRREYRKSLGVVEGRQGSPSPSPTPTPAADNQSKPASTTASSAPAPASGSNTSSSAPSAPTQKIQDFFDSIQADQQPTMFGGPAQQINYSQVAPTFNPFRQSMMMPQQTGFMAPQMTGFPMMQQQPQQPFLQPQATGAMAFGQQQQPFQQSQPPFQSQPFMQPQQTGFIQPQQHAPQLVQPQPTGFLQPQATGANPFRQSVSLNTNFAGGSIGRSGPSGAFSQPSSPFHPTSSTSFASIQRPGSTPAEGSGVKPLVAQPTGSKNPFAPAGGVTSGSMAGKPQSKGPSMNELAMGFGQTPFQGSNQAQGLGGLNSPWGNGTGSVNGRSGPSGNDTAGAGISDVASSFAFDGSKSATNGNSGNDFMAQFGSLSVNTNTNTNSGFGTGTPSTSATPFPLSSQSQSQSQSQFGSLSSPTSPSGNSGSAFLQPQPTGYGGSAIKPFKPTSSFGSQLVHELGPISETGSPITSPGVGGMQNQSTGFPGMSGGGNTQSAATGGMSQFGAFSGLGTNPTGTQTGTGTNGLSGISSQSAGMGAFGNSGAGMGMGMGMGQQPTGGNAGANPFRASTMFGSITSPGSGMGSTGFAGQGAGAFGANSPFAGQNGRAGQAQGPGQGQGQGTGMGMGQFGGIGGFGQGQGQQGQGQGGSLI